MNLWQRLKLAGNIVKSGAPFPFNRITPYDTTGGEPLCHPYKQSAWVQRAIKKISGPISAVDLEFYLDGQVYRDAALEAFWAHPAVDGAGAMSRADFIEASVGWLKLEGEFFWIMDDSWLMPFPAGGNVSPLIVARPDHMRHIVKHGQITGWDYVAGGGEHVVLLPEQVIHGKMWNPYDRFRGCSEMHAARDAAESDFMAGKFNKNLMANNGDQGVFVVAKNGLPSDGQRQMIIDQLREKRELSQRGQFRAVFLAGDVEIQDARVRVPDQAFINIRLENRHEIYIALGVPPSMADVRASYSIGSASDWFMLITETCMPTGERLAQAISHAARRQTGRPLRASFDWDEHPVMQAVRRERADTAQKYFQMGVPMRALNDYLALGLPAFPGWEKGYLPAKLTTMQ
ncbi:MAG TPA: phage portal protein [Verrucomicrobiae bacterium]|jgi:phage portal protein BeeE|nr:phage portal protein [Verrucomicrobiae bacterium]